MTHPFKTFFTSKILVIFALFISFHSYAQNYTSSESYSRYEPNVKFGVIDAESLTIEQILANPKLTSKDANCEVLGFVLRIGRREYDYYGPYRIKGNEIPEDILDLLDNIDALRGKLYFDDIRVKCNGKEMTLSYDYVLRYYR